MKDYLNAMQRYFDFRGRSTRSQFWFYTLVLAILLIIGLILDAALNTDPTGAGSPIAGFIALVHVIPNLAVTVRRLHDIDRSGWWVLIGLIPLIGLIVLLVFACTASTAGTNRFGAPATDAAVTPLNPVGVAPVGAAPATVSGDYLDQLEKLTKLKAAGSIDDAEFQSMKSDLLARSKR